MSKKYKKDYLWELAAIAAVMALSFLFSLQSANNIWHTGNTYTDSSVFSYVARIILKGGMPYRDTFDHKGPLIYLINAAGIKIAPWRGVWVFELVAIFISFYFIYRTAALMCSRISAIAVLFVCSAALFKYFEGGNFTEEYAMPFIAVSIYIFADYFLNMRINIFRLIMCGFGFGAVCMLRVNMVTVWVVMCLGVFVVCVRKKMYKQLGKFILFFLAGMAMICIPFLLWFILQHAFTDFVRDYILFNFTYVNSMDAGMKSVMRGRAFLHFLNDNIVLSGICISVYFSIRKKRYFDVLYSFYLVVNLLFISMSGCTYMHYGMILVPAMAYPFALAGRSCEEEIKKDTKAVLLVSAAFVITITVPVWLNGLNHAFGLYASKDEKCFGEAEENVVRVVQEYTDKDEQIIVCGNWNIIYTLSGRFAASRYSYQDTPCALDEDRNAEFLREIETNRPKLVVIDDHAFVRDEVMSFVERHDYEEIFFQEGDKNVYIFCQKD